jgi:uncharacterized sporulation protein YeaH/YhbH (DUF444 family)
MDHKGLKYYNQLKTKGLTPKQEQEIFSELYAEGSHHLPEDTLSKTESGIEFMVGGPERIYDYHDLLRLQNIPWPVSSYVTCLRSIDDLLEQDKQREEDGFPKKIRVGRMVKPGKGGKDKIVVVPTTVEEKFIHDHLLRPSEEGGSSGGSGEGEEGEVIGEEPVRAPDQKGGAGSGEGEESPHEIESNAYDIGKILSEKFELPNLKDKGKKRFLTRYTYDLTDKHRGFGQFLDKKATLRKIVETNISLGNLTDPGDIDPTRFIISPYDRIYRVLSREKDYESQAMVFFLRDYSGSMYGKSTELVVSQHVLIYSWLLYQYARQVETRFILHDTDAKEVPDFYTYYNSAVAGGTRVASAYRLVNEIAENENLAQDYNIYVFHGTDGDDWDKDGKEALTELEKILTYVNRMGITVAEHTSNIQGVTAVEGYVKESKLLEEKPKLLRLDIMSENDDEPRLIEGIKKLISE